MKTFRLLLAVTLGIAAAHPASAQDVSGPAGGTMTVTPAVLKPPVLVEVLCEGWADASPPLTYAFSVNGNALGNPSTTPSVTFGGQVAEGPYTVAARITDAVGNFTDVSRTFVVDGTPPIVAAPDYARGLAATPAGVEVTFNVSVTDNIDPAPFVSITPPSGSIFPIGTTQVVIVARDAAGNEAAPQSFNVTVERSYLETATVAHAGIVAGNRIGTDLLDAPGFKLTKLGVPTITNRRIIAVSGAARDGTGKTLAGVLLGQIDDGSASFVMPLRVGAPVPESAGLGAGLAWKAFPREPLMDYQDDFSTVSGPELAFYGRVAGPGVTSANDDVLGYYALPEVDDEVLVAFAREGGDAPGVEGGKFKNFMSAAMAVRTLTFGVLPPERAVMFTAMLQTGPSGTPGPGGVDKTNDMGLWVWEAGELKLALREGQEIDGRTVRSFVALRGPVGHGHGVTEDLESYHAAAVQDRHGFTTTVLITFTDGGRRLAVAGAGGTGKLIDENTDLHWVDAGESLPWGRFASFSRNGYGMTVMLTSLRGVPSAVNAAVLFETGDAESFHRVLKGDTLPDGSVLTALATPIGNRGQGLAFAGKTNTGVNGRWWGNAGQNALGMAEYFRVGGAAVAANGGVWKTTNFNALPDGMGPLFTAKLRAGSARAPAPGGVTALNDLGLWAVDSFGTTHLLIREGQALGGKTVRTFRALTSVAGSPAQARSFNGKRDVLVWVLATDNTTHLVHFAVP